MRDAITSFAETRSISEIGHRGPAVTRRFWLLEDEISMPIPEPGSIGRLDRIRLGNVVQRSR